MTAHPTIDETPFRWARSALVIGLVSVAVAVVGAFFDPARFFRCYLVAWIPLLGLCLGSLALVMIHHLTGGVWGVLVRRILEAQMSTLPLVALLFLPLLFGLGHIYPWATTELATEHWSQFRLRYLSSGFVAARWILYFVVWGVLVFLFRRWSTQQDSTARVEPASAARNVAGPGLVLYGLSMQFASVDWMMSIDPHFTSTAYAPIVASVQLLSAFCVTLLVFAVYYRSSEIQAAISEAALNDLGNLLLALLSVWTYLVWFQYMLIWMADLRHDNVWYLQRRTWQTTAWMLALIGFAAPFFALLLRAVKRNPASLARVAFVILGMQLLFIGYQLLPSLGLHTIAEFWMTPVLMIGLGGIWSAAFAWFLGSRPLVPRHDRNWPHALHLRELEAEHHEREEALEHA